MIRETYRGVTIQTARGQRGYTKLTVNGVNLGDQDGTEAHVLRIAKGTVDLVQDGDGFSECEAHWYPRGTVDPKALARQIIAERFEAPKGQRAAVREYVARRIAEIVEGMGRTPANYDARTGLLTEDGAALVKQIIGTDAATGCAWREIGQMVDEAAAQRTAALIGA